MLRATARPGLLAARFRTVNLQVVAGQWTQLDPEKPEVRADLLAYVPAHIRLAVGQEAILAEAGLELADGKLVDVRATRAADAKKPPIADTKKPAKS